MGNSYSSSQLPPPPPYEEKDAGLEEYQKAISYKEQNNYELMKYWLYESIKKKYSPAAYMLGMQYNTECGYNDMYKKFIQIGYDLKNKECAIELLNYNLNYVIYDEDKYCKIESLIIELFTIYNEPIDKYRDKLIDMQLNDLSFDEYFEYGYITNDKMTIPFIIMENLVALDSCTKWNKEFLLKLLSVYNSSQNITRLEGNFHDKLIERKIKNVSDLKAFYYKKTYYYINWALVNSDDEELIKRIRILQKINLMTWNYFINAIKY